MTRSIAIQPSPRSVTRLTLGVIATGSLIGAGLLAAPVSHAAAEDRLIVTTAEDQAPGGTPATGSLRWALAEVQDRSTGSGEAETDFVVEIASGLDPIVLSDSIDTVVGELANSLTIIGAPDMTGRLDLGGHQIDLSTAGDALASSTIENLTIENGTWRNTELQVDEHTITNVTLTEIHDFGMPGTVADTLNNVNSVDTRFDSVGETNPGPYALTITGSTFDVSPVAMTKTDNTEVTISVSESTFENSAGAYALNLHNLNPDAPFSFTGTGLTVRNNAEGGVLLDGLTEGTVSDSTFSGQHGSGALSMRGSDSENNQFKVSGSSFTEGTGMRSPLIVTGDAKTIEVVNNTFSGNTPESGASALDIEATPSTAATLRIDRNTFSGNHSEDSSATQLESWLSYTEGTTASLTQNSFLENSSDYGPADFSSMSLGTGDPGSASLEVQENTFREPSGDEYSGRSVSLGMVAGAEVTLTNNTFAGAEGPVPFLTSSGVQPDSTVRLTNNTIVGGGIDLGYPDEDATDAVTVLASVFDTAGDPLTFADEPATVTVHDVFTRTASASMPGATQADTAAFALAGLADNSGPTLTMMPGEESVLVDAVTGAEFAPRDQRGVERPVGDRADVGAVERDPVEEGVISLVTDLTVEEGSDAVIPVNRTGPNPAGASVTLTAVEGTALLNDDYTLAGGDVSFAASEETAQATELRFPTVARPGAQGPRTFSVSLSNPAEGSVLGEPSTVTVTITDREEGPGVDADADADADADGGVDADGAADADAGADADGQTGGPDPVTPAKPGGNLATTGQEPGYGLLWGAILTLGLGGTVLALRLSRRRANSAIGLEPDTE